MAGLALPLVGLFLASLADPLMDQQHLFTDHGPDRRSPRLWRAARPSGTYHREDVRQYLALAAAKGPDGDEPQTRLNTVGT